MYQYLRFLKKHVTSIPDLNFDLKVATPINDLFHSLVDTIEEDIKYKDEETIIMLVDIDVSILALSEQNWKIIHNKSTMFYMVTNK